MSGRIWFVETNNGTRAEPDWRTASTPSSVRKAARNAQKGLRLRYGPTRVVQYVRQGDAR